MPSSAAHRALLGPSGGSAGAAGIPGLKFHSQVAHRADLAVWAVPTCSLPAASFHAGSLGMPQAAEARDGGSWGEQGSFRRSQRASQLSEILSFSKEG